MTMNTIAKKLLLGVIGFGLTMPLQAANLMQVYQQALQSDPTFKAAGAQRLSETQNVPIARSFLLPQIFISSATSLYNIQENQTKKMKVIKTGRRGTILTW